MMRRSMERAPKKVNEPNFGSFSFVVELQQLALMARLSFRLFRLSIPALGSANVAPII
ncbi:hypothetical protein [Alsobacter soli]|uniref:hypothetical protein n=1 Tax=Alsobacter soli TaxID=2109933 RepID=UPI001AED0544|nr:hypothetical protein [Alsobacter soli]